MMNKLLCSPSGFNSVWCRDVTAAGSLFILQKRVFILVLIQKSWMRRQLVQLGMIKMEAACNVRSG